MTVRCKGTFNRDLLFIGKTTRLVATLLCASMVFNPVYALGAQDNTSSTETAKKKAHSAKKATTKHAAPATATPAAKSAHSGAKKTAKHPHAKSSSDRNAVTADPPEATPAAKRKSAARGAATARLRQAFVASNQLRPMAQQLALLRTPAAYSGVTNFAHQNSGDAAEAAYMALGSAYLTDRKYPEAIANFKLAMQHGDQLADYAYFLAARAQHASGNYAMAESLLHGFNTRFPESIFAAQAPEVEAENLLSMNDAAGANRVLLGAANTASAARSGYQLQQAMVALALGSQPEAMRILKHLLLTHPLSSDAGVAYSKLVSIGGVDSLTASELRSLGDAYYNAGRYSEASTQYHALARLPGIDASTRNGIAVAAAACDLKLKRLTPADVLAVFI